MTPVEFVHLGAKGREKEWKRVLKCRDPADQRRRVSLEEWLSQPDVPVREKPNRPAKKSEKCKIVKKSTRKLPRSEVLAKNMTRAAEKCVFFVADGDPEVDMPLRLKSRRSSKTRSVFDYSKQKTHARRRYTKQKVQRASQKYLAGQLSTPPLTVQSICTRSLDAYMSLGGPECDRSSNNWLQTFEDGRQLRAELPHQKSRR